jgi:hypothetical protein
VVWDQFGHSDFEGCPGELIRRDFENGGVPVRREVEVLGAGLDDDVSDGIQVLPHVVGAQHTEFGPALERVLAVLDSVERDLVDSAGGVIHPACFFRPVGVLPDVDCIRALRRNIYRGQRE